MPDIRDRNVYILGAGFSASAGVPVVHDFIDRSRSYFDDPSGGLDKADREHFAKFLEFKRRMSYAREKVKIDLDNIEQLFGLVEMSCRLGNESVGTRVSTVHVIAKTLELATRTQRVDQIIFSANEEIQKKLGALPMGFGQPSGFGPPTLGADMYTYFAGLASGLLDDPEQKASRTNTFITFNYDLVLEDALNKVGLSPDYHLPPNGMLVEDEVPPIRKVSVLKLHGSTNWGVCPKCNRHLVVLAKDIFGVSSEVRSIDCDACKQPLQLLLIPPSWDKSEYLELMRPIWAKAVEELKLASRICVIGYSMPEADSFFKYLIALALSENHNLYKFIVVDKNPAMARRYRQLLEPVFRERRLKQYLDPMGFANFLSHGNSHVDLRRGELVGSNLGRR